jgi:hypothetical protein
MPKGREIRHAEVSSSGGNPNAGTFDALRDLQKEAQRQKKREARQRYREHEKQDIGHYECLVAAGRGDTIPLKETFDLPDPTWLQF